MSGQPDIRLAGYQILKKAGRISGTSLLFSSNPQHDHDSKFEEKISRAVPDSDFEAGSGLSGCKKKPDLDIRLWPVSGYPFFFHNAEKLIFIMRNGKKFVAET